VGCWYIGLEMFESYASQTKHEPLCFSLSIIEIEQPCLTIGGYEHIAFESCKKMLYYSKCNILGNMTFWHQMLYYQAFQENGLCQRKMLFCIR
jgi:hypothetical protein